MILRNVRCNVEDSLLLFIPHFPKGDVARQECQLCSLYICY